MNAPIARKRTGGGSIARHPSIGGGLAITLVMFAVCAAMAWRTARQTRAHVADFAGAKASAAAQALDAFDSASKVLAERFHASFASSFWPELQVRRGAW